MADGIDDHLLPGIVNRVDDAIVAHANPQGVTSAQFNNAGRTWIVGEGQCGAGNAGLNMVGKSGQAFLAGVWMSIV